ncbi:MAG: acyl-CoA dehydrogenase family protein [Pseudomonadota bacterium]
MDFELSSEQTLLKDSIDRFVLDKYDFDSRQKLARGATGYSEDNWKMMAEMGWLALPFSEDVGGFGGTPVETAILMESFGTGLVLEPYLASILLGGKLIELAGSDEQKEAILAPLIEGEHLLSVGYAEPQSRFDLHDVATGATKAGDTYKLSGHKTMALNAATANTLIVSARTSGERRDEAGISLFLVDAQASGLTLKNYATLDGGRASDVILDGAEATLLGAEGEGLSYLNQVIDHAICAICAEAVGAIAKVNEVTLDYAKTRVQFEKSIGANQVIQHRLADMLIEEEMSRTMSAMASMRLIAEPEQRGAIASATKARVNEAAVYVGEQGIQVHGGIGMTDEYIVGHYYKRLMVIEKLFGPTDFHHQRYAELAE